MRFSRLRLTGFKSFVDPTDLIISDGLTGVVGPNGCGKSNLLEALRWVMGENRPTAMRGGGMEDVIFAGAATRPARNFAEVALHMDNSDRLAPQGFNESDALEIVRRITRDVGSAYKANTKDVRARDVQMLFADASTGAHSPALVRQGQIAELINAKPKARRRILEEAAGISGLYQRRHEAELKLNGAETNLTRVDDVLEQLAAQLSQLDRQARQAARYRSIGEALRAAEGQLLFRRWHEADLARAEAEDALKERVLIASRSEAAVQQSLKLRQAAEAALPPLREEEAVAAAVLQRLLVERDKLSDEAERAQDTIRTLTARLEQLSRDTDRETSLNNDAGETIKRLEDEAKELEEASVGHDTALAEAAQQAGDAAQVLQDRETLLSQETEDAARLAARHQSATRLLEDSRKMLERSESEADKAKAALAQAEATRLAAQSAFNAAQTSDAEAQTAVVQAEEALTKADQARATAQAREAEARGKAAEVEGEAGAIRAEISALAKLLERDTAEGGQVMDDIRVSEGFEKALGAALNDDLRAPLTDVNGSSGWITLPGYDRAQKLPAGTQPMSLHVTGPDTLRRRLDQIGLVDAEQGAALQKDLLPGQRLVSAEGDLWRWDGFRTRAQDAPSAAALRLEQLNRLEALKQEMATITARVDGATKAHELLSRELAELTEADKAARDARRAADQAAAQAARALSRSEADVNLAEGKLETLGLTLARHQEEALAARTQLKDAEDGMKDLGDLDTARARLEDIKQAVEAARITMMTRRSAHDELRREGETRTKRGTEIARELSTWRTRLATAETRVSELVTRRSETEAELKDARTAPERIERDKTAIASDISKSEARKTEASDALSTAEGTLRDALQTERDIERAASEAREDRARAEALCDAARETVAQAAERIAEEMQLTPNQLLTQLDVSLSDMASAEALEAEVNRHKRQRDALGAVNLRAEEDAKEVRDELDTLQGEKADLEEAIKTLRSGISSLNREGRERLLTAFEQVNSNFAMLFKHLFGGGDANLVMVESDDPLEAGLEIMCQPPGKKLATLSLLSGGEQTLTAMALIFAVFLANPAPICVLDEVDAPLDDANVTRFCDLLDEMCRQTETRFLIITHHAVTMSRMDRLFGVTMQEQGVSQLVSVDLKKAEALVA